MTMFKTKLDIKTIEDKSSVKEWFFRQSCKLFSD